MIKGSFVLPAAAWWVLSVVPTASATDITPQPDGSWTLENAALKVTVVPPSGDIKVLDKEANHEWLQPRILNHRAFTSAALYGDTVKQFGFWTVFSDATAGNIDAFVLVMVPDGKREVHLNVNLADASVALGGFDFLEPFTLNTANSFLAVTDWHSGHLYPTNLTSWPGYWLDPFFDVTLLQIPWVGVFDISSGLGYSLTVDSDVDARIKLPMLNNRRAPVVTWMPEKGQFGANGRYYSRTLTYTFTASGSYVALAKAYREYLKAKQPSGLVLLKDKAAQNPLIKRLYGAPLLWDYFHNINPNLATALGVEKALQHVSTWGNNTYLKSISVAETNSFGWLSEAYYTFVDAYPLDATHTTPDIYYDVYPTSFMKDKDGNVIKGWYDSNGQQYMRCPQFFVERAQAHMSAAMAALPLTSLYIDVHPIRPEVECYDTVHPKTKTNYRQDVIALSSYLRSLGRVMTGEHSKWWNTPYYDEPLGLMAVLSIQPWGCDCRPRVYGKVSYCLKKDTNGNNICAGCLQANESCVSPAFAPYANPMDPWQRYEQHGSLGHQYRVPLWELVFHDSVINNWYPSDTQDYNVNTSGLPFSYQKKKDLLTLLYGNVPTFMSIGSAHDGDLASGWFYDRLAFMESYRNTCKAHEVLADQEMIKHEFIGSTRDVQKTTWEDQTQIVANFGAADFATDVTGASLTLKNLGYAVAGPKIQASRAYDPGLGKEVTRIRKDGYDFSDAQGAPLALRRISSQTLRVNLDQPSAPLSLLVDPTKVMPANWKFATTHVWKDLLSRPDPQNKPYDWIWGKHQELVPWTQEGNQIRLAGPFSDWTVLDITDASAVSDRDFDFKADLAEYTPGDSYAWKIWKSSTGFVQVEEVAGFGQNAFSDIPLLVDFNNDGRSDLLIYRPATPFNPDLLVSQWYLRCEQNPCLAGEYEVMLQFGDGGTPLSGDFDGDRKADLAVVTSESPMTWQALLSSTNFDNQQLLTKTFGDAALGDVPQSVDVDGQGKNDWVVYRPGVASRFLVLSQETGQAFEVELGKSGDIPLSGDFDGDGLSDFAVVTALQDNRLQWKMRFSASNFTNVDLTHVELAEDHALLIKIFGDANAGDIPVLGDFNGLGLLDLAVFRPGAPNQWRVMFRESEQTDAAYPTASMPAKPIGVICDGKRVPLPETCDHVDNDCDLLTDEGELCGPSQECRLGSCVEVEGGKEKDAGGQDGDADQPGTNGENQVSGGCGCNGETALQLELLIGLFMAFLMKRRIFQR